MSIDPTTGSSCHFENFTGMCEDRQARNVRTKESVVYGSEPGPKQTQLHNTARRRSCATLL